MCENIPIGWIGLRVDEETRIDWFSHAFNLGNMFAEKVRGRRLADWFRSIHGCHHRVQVWSAQSNGCCQAEKILEFFEVEVGGGSDEEEVAPVVLVVPPTWNSDQCDPIFACKFLFQ